VFCASKAEPLFGLSYMYVGLSYIYLEQTDRDQVLISTRWSQSKRKETHDAKRIGASRHRREQDTSMEPFSSFRTPSSGPSNATSEARDDIGAAVERGKANIAGAASSAGIDVAGDLRMLRADLAKLQATLATFASTVGKETGLAAKDVGSTVANQAGAVASEVAQSGADLAASAAAQAKTFASELEAMARKNPLGTLASTLLVGVVIGMMSRGSRG
jgi:ElaB/YqjD/DUF883 family membrane-anchored ribosome-binding protein